MAEETGKVVALHPRREGQPWVTKAQVARHFAVSEKTIERWQKQPGFPDPLRAGSSVRYRTAAIETWLRTRTDQ